MQAKSAKPNETGEWMRVRELAAAIGVGKDTARGIALALPRTWITDGGHVRIHRLDVEAYLQSRRVKGGAA
jgi:hypothetical protein